MTRMKNQTFLTILSAIVFALGFAFHAGAADLSVHGQPPLGAFGMENLEQITSCRKLGMTLVFTYSASRGKELLDPATPAGKFIAAHKMQVMYNLSSRFTGVRLAREIGPEDTTLPVENDKRETGPEAIRAFPQSGVLVIEGERIAYAGRTTKAFTGCTRGAEGTRPGRHQAGLLLCNSDALRRDLLAIKDSPNLWGFWLVDDARPFEGDCLKEMSRVIHDVDRKADGAPYHHVIVMGIGGSSAMENFSPGICDALGIYLYPYHNGRLSKSSRRQLSYIMTLAKAQQPEIGILGIPQLFQQQHGTWNIMVTPEQAREDALAYLEQGAAGFVPFIYHWLGPGGVPQGFEAFPAIREAVGKLYGEIRGGALQPGRPTFKKTEWNRVLAGAEARPSAGAALFDYADPAGLNALCRNMPAGRLVADPHEFSGQNYPVRMNVSRFDNADPKSDQWPAVRLEAKLLAQTDFAKYRWLEQPVYNPLDHTVPLAADLAGGDGYGWVRRCIPVPPRTPVLLRLPISEAAIVTDVSNIRHWRVWFNAPSEDLTLYLGNPVLVAR